MIKKLLPLAAGAALFMLASAASAAQPAQLSDSQMDGVTAGGTAIGNAAALALGEVMSDTITQTSTNVTTAGSPLSWIAIGQAASQSLASGGFLFQAAAVSHADTAASLP